MMIIRTVMLLPVAILALGMAGCSSETSGRGDASAGAVEQGAVNDITAAQAKALIDGEAPVIVIDVRTPEEFAEGHIEGALNIDFHADNFEQELAKLDRNQRYIVHCQSGRRSSSSMDIFQDLGFVDIQHMFEGFKGWQGAGFVVVQ